MRKHLDSWIDELDELDGVNELEEIDDLEEVDDDGRCEDRGRSFGCAFQWLTSQDMGVAAELARAWIRSEEEDGPRVRFGESHAIGMLHTLVASRSAPEVVRCAPALALGPELARQGGVEGVAAFLDLVIRLAAEPAWQAVFSSERGESAGQVLRFFDLLPETLQAPVAGRLWREMSLLEGPGTLGYWTLDRWFMRVLLPGPESLPTTSPDCSRGLVLLNVPPQEERTRRKHLNSVALELFRALDGEEEWADSVDPLAYRLGESAPAGIAGQDLKRRPFVRKKMPMLAPLAGPALLNHAPNSVAFVILLTDDPVLDAGDWFERWQGRLRVYGREFHKPWDDPTVFIEPRPGAPAVDQARHVLDHLKATIPVG